MPRHLLQACLVALFQLSLCPWVLAAAPIVDLGYAQYQGTVDAGLRITNFLGIRYAAAPIGAFNGKREIAIRFDSCQDICDGLLLRPRRRHLAYNKLRRSLTNVTSHRQEARQRTRSAPRRSVL